MATVFCNVSGELSNEFIGDFEANFLKATLRVICKESNAKLNINRKNSYKLQGALTSVLRAHDQLTELWNAIHWLNLKRKNQQLALIENVDIHSYVGDYKKIIESFKRTEDHGENENPTRESNRNKDLIDSNDSKNNDLGFENLNPKDESEKVPVNDTTQTEHIYTPIDEADDVQIHVTSNPIPESVKTPLHFTEISGTQIEPSENEHVHMGLKSLSIKRRCSLRKRSKTNCYNINKCRVSSSDVTGLTMEFGERQHELIESPTGVITAPSPSTPQKEASNGKVLYECEFCDYKNVRKCNLKGHIRRMHNERTSTDTALPCEQYDHVPGSDEDLIKNVKNNKHSHKRHKGKRKMFGTEGSSEQNEIFKCELCNYTSRRKSNLKEHVRRSHMEYTKQIFPCNKCGKWFGFGKDLKRHMLLHENANIPCDKCGIVFRNKSALQYHKRSHNPAFKTRVACKLCTSTFSKKAILDKHVKVVHMGIKELHLCQTCGKVFSQRRSYIIHTNAHLGKKPYVCEVCGKAFTYEKSIKEHRRTHSQERAFECKICFKTFRQSSGLNSHKNIHDKSKRHTCKDCGRGFTQKQALLRHERIHSGLKPFSCCMCARQFSDVSTARRHMLLIHKIDPQYWREYVKSDLKRDSWFVEPVNTDNIEDTDHSVPKRDQQQKYQIATDNVTSINNSHQNKSIETYELTPDSRSSESTNSSVQNEHVQSNRDKCSFTTDVTFGEIQNEFSQQSIKIGTYSLYTLSNIVNDSRV